MPTIEEVYYNFAEVTNGKADFSGAKEFCAAPGVVFSGGEGPSPRQCRALLDELRSEPAKAGEGPPVIAADSGLLLARAAGIRPDLIIGDMDSLEGVENRGRPPAGGFPPSPLAGYPPETIRRYPADKDFTDTELAVFSLFERGCFRYWIIGGGGGRIDHLFGIRSLFERTPPPERWVTAAEDIHCIEGRKEQAAPENAAVPEKFVFNPAKENGAAGKNRRLNPVSIFPLGEGPWEAESEGLKWPLDGLSWNRGFFGVSNEAGEGRFWVKAIRGRFMVILPLI